MDRHTAFGMTPYAVASKLLQEHGGKQRAAEVEAWAHADVYENETAERSFWLTVVRAIALDFSEEPRVVRTDSLSVAGRSDRFGGVLGAPRAAGADHPSPPIGRR